MGTSTSSKGPPSRVQFDPPWISDVAQQIEPKVASVTMPVDFSSSARFGSARRKLAEYLASRQQPALRSSFSRYVRRGLGGTAHATSRLQIPIAASVVIWSTLQKILNREEIEKDENAWISRILAAENKLVALEKELLQQIIPDGGTIDEESCRQSIAFALSEFERENQDISVEDYNEESIVSIMELFLSREIFNRYILDMGQHLERMDIACMPMVEKEIGQYIRASLSVKLRGNISGTRRHYTKDEMISTMKRVMYETFEVFAGGDDE